MLKVFHLMVATTKKDFKKNHKYIFRTLTRFGGAATLILSFWTPQVSKYMTASVNTLTKKFKIEKCAPGSLALNSSLNYYYWKSFIRVQVQGEWKCVLMNSDNFVKLLLFSLLFIIFIDVVFMFGASWCRCHWISNNFLHVWNLLVSFCSNFSDFVQSE